jgi:hypothetical protein
METATQTQRADRKIIIPDFVSAMDAQTAKRIKQFPNPNNRASEAGHPCVRYLTAKRLKTEMYELPSLELQRIFEEGSLHEKAVLRELEDSGFEVVEQQRAYQWRKFQLTGHIDAKVRIEGIEPEEDAVIPVDIKSSSPNVFPAIKESEPIDMLQSKYFWIRKYPAQILLYMLMDGIEAGSIIFKNKTTGEKCQKDFFLDDHLDYIDTVLQKLEMVNLYVENEELPQVEQIDECRRCGFCKTLCFPGQDYGPGFNFIADEEVEQMLERRAELEEAKKEYAELDSEIKKKFRGRNAVVGDWKIESSMHETTRYNLPADLKKQYAVKSEVCRLKIERL